MQVRNAQTNKTEQKFKIVPGFLKVCTNAPSGFRPPMHRTRALPPQFLCPLISLLSISCALPVSCAQVRAHPEINRIFELQFTPTKSAPKPDPLTLVADSVHSRDIIVLVLRGLNNSGL